MDEEQPASIVLRVGVKLDVGQLVPAINVPNLQLTLAVAAAG